MVKLEYRPYLLALLGLTVCVSLYEIVYVQWDLGPELSPPQSPSAPISLFTSLNDTREIDLPIPRHGSSGGGSSRRRTPAEGEGASSEQGKTGNRGILSSGRITANLNAAAAGGAKDEHPLTTLPESVDLETLPKNDFKNLIDIQNEFDFLINQKPCPARTYSSPGNSSSTRSQHEDPLLVLVLVHSAPRNFRKRLTIRQTWANHPDPAMRVYFMLGSVESRTLQFKLEMENERFGDIIQGNFTDAYRNMTYKHVMALKWFTYFCADTPILLKTDDDVFVNSPALMEYVRENVDGVRTRRKFVKCRVLENGAVKRTYRSKWRVSTKEYPSPEYPPYCPGFIVLYSRDMVQQLYRAAQFTKYFWIDDVHVTGTLVQKVNATLTPFRDVFFPAKNRKRLREPYVRNMPLFTDPDLREKDIRRMWRMVVVEGTEGGKFRESMQEDDEAVAYLSIESGSGRVSVSLGKLLSWWGVPCLVLVSRRWIVS